MDALLAEEQPKPFTIADYIAAGEGETVEFKGSLRWDFRSQQVNKALEKTIARTVAAFMNAKGGTLVIGVSDQGKILGLEADLATFGTRRDRDGWEQALRNVLNTYLSKEVAALASVTFADVDGKTVAVLHADPALRPVYLTDNNIAELYVRSGNTNQELDVKQATEYIKRQFPAVA
jgi:predicted HTH transcriptional regulator